MIRIAVIEDQADIREGFAFLISNSPGFSSVGAFRSVEEALPEIKRHSPSVVLLDLGLPGMSGLEGIGVIRAVQPEARILVLTVSAEQDKVFRALCAGASGYLLKTTPPAKVLEAVTEVVGGGAPMSPEIAHKVIALFKDIRPPSGVNYDLTPHEVRILRLLVEGHNYRTMAGQLGVSVNTIGFHMKRIYEKLEVHSKSEAVSKALRDRLVS